VRKQTEGSKNRLKIRDLFVGERCSQAILDFLSATHVGRRVGTESAEEDVMSKASELELRERGDETKERSGIGSEWGVWTHFLFFGPGQGGGQGRATSCRKDSGRKRIVCIVTI